MAKRKISKGKTTIYKTYIIKYPYNNSKFFFLDQNNTMGITCGTGIIKSRYQS
jgi:hypothetical protein